MVAWCLTHWHPIFHAFPPRCRILSVRKRGVVPWKERSDPRGVTAERGIKMVAGRSGGFSSRQAVLVVTSPSAGLTWCTHHVDGETRSSCDDVIICYLWGKRESTEIRKLLSVDSITNIFDSEAAIVRDWLISRINPNLSEARKEPDFIRTHFEKTAYNKNPICNIICLWISSTRQ